MWPLAALAILASGAVLAGGCGDGDETTTPAGEATATETTVAANGKGRQLYIEAGCGGCHGEQGQGTEVGPALAGHSEEIVVRQVRSPLDMMPAYSQARLSDEDLHEVAEYVASLAPAETHVEPLKLSGLVATHHWMALTATGTGNLEDAIHHVDHIIDLVKGKHLAAMKEAREHLETGDAHEAEHLIEGMLAGTAEPDLSLKQLHLKLALSAVEIDDPKDAIHHVRHFVELARGAERREGRAVLASVEEGDLHSAQHGLEGLLGQTHEG